MKRYRFIDYLKVIALGLILFDHLGIGRNTEWYIGNILYDLIGKPFHMIQNFSAFSMVLIFMICGFLFAHAVEYCQIYKIKFLVNQIIKIYIPLFISVLSFSIVQQFVSTIMKDARYWKQFTNIQWVKSATLWGYLDGTGDLINGTTWYLVPILIFYLLGTFIVDKNRDKLKSILWLDFILVIGYAVFYFISIPILTPFINNSWYITFIINGVICYYYKKEEFHLKNTAILIGINYFLALYGIRMYSNHFYYKEPYMISALLAFLIFAILLQFEDRLKEQKWILKCARNSYYVYLVHMTYGSLFLSVVKIKQNNTLIFGITCIFVYIVASIHKKYCNWIFNKNVEKIGNRKKQVILLSILVLACCNILYTIWFLHQYPQLKLDKETFYGTEGENLKDFERKEEDMILSTSNDPWVMYDFYDPIKISVLNIEIRTVSTEGLWGQVFLIQDPNIYKENTDFFLYSEENIVYFPRITDDKIDRIRIDLASYKGISLDVKQIIVNPRKEIVITVQRRFLPFIGFFLLSEILLLIWLDQKNKRNRKASVIEIFLYTILQMFLFLYVLKVLENDQDYFSRLIWCSVIFITEILFLIFISLQRSNKRRIGLFYFFIISVINFGIIEVLSEAAYEFENIFAGIANIGIFLIGSGVLYLLFGKFKFAILFPNFCAFILSITNYYYYIFRGEPFEITALVMADTATKVIENYKFEINETIQYIILVELCIILAVSLIDSKDTILKSKKEKGEWSLVLLCAIIVIAYRIPTVNLWNMNQSTQEWGYIYSFLGYTKSAWNRLKPEDYTTLLANTILDRYSNTEEIVSEKTNIILIMNEAFADLPAIYGFETDVDSMPFFHSLEENTIKGEMLVSVFGGTTANTEFEVLTGNSMAFLKKGSVPYVQNIMKEQQSFASYLKNMGYRTIAFHPYNGDGYKRRFVYPLLGFEQFYTIDDELDYNDKIRYYMSDNADFCNIIELYKKRDLEAPFFIFNVTMQNHGGYSNTLSSIPVTVNPKDEELQKAQLQEYLSLIKESDTALEQLIHYFSGIEERTIICMFGDHQPGLDKEIYKLFEPSIFLNDISLEKAEMKYKVPFLIWANYDIDEKQDVFLSSNYLRSMILETAGINLSSFDRFLLECQQEYPAINAYGYYNKEGEVFDIDIIPKDSLLYEYSVLVYYNMFDKTKMQQSYFLR